MGFVLALLGVTPARGEDAQGAILAAMIAEPNERLHRLVYADWLEEQGKANTAALIRMELELSQTRSDQKITSLLFDRLAFLPKATPEFLEGVLKQGLGNADGPPEVVYRAPANALLWENVHVSHGYRRLVVEFDRGLQRVSFDLDSHRTEDHERLIRSLPRETTSISLSVPAT